MNYMSYIPCDLVNGPGARCTLFLSGCSHGCKGCYNTDSWNPKHGEPFTQECEDRVIADLQSTERPLQGLSLSGGDPMFKNNRGRVLELLKRVKAECPDKDVWLWTGYDFGELLSMDSTMKMLPFIDVIVDGKFEQDKYDPELQYRGSSNQCVIEVQTALVNELGYLADELERMKKPDDVIAMVKL